MELDAKNKFTKDIEDTKKQLKHNSKNIEQIFLELRDESSQSDPSLSLIQQILQLNADTSTENPIKQMIDEYSQNQQDSFDEVRTLQTYNAEAIKMTEFTTNIPPQVALIIISRYFNTYLASVPKSTLKLSKEEYIIEMIVGYQYTELGVKNVENTESLENDKDLILENVQYSKQLSFQIKMYKISSGSESETTARYFLEFKQFSGDKLKFYHVQNDILQYFSKF